MQRVSLFAAALLLSAFPFSSATAQQSSGEEEFEQMAAALKADDSERRSAIETCIQQGIGDNPAAAAEFMGVPVEKAARAWCIRMTTGIASGKLHLVDINGLSEGTVTPAAQSVLTTVAEGE